MTPLTVCFLTRNHQISLARAIQSVQSLGVRVLVADTGSTDDTTTIARQQGADLIECPWKNDFAAAANETLANVATEWVLWMNPDEELTGDLDAIRNTIGTPAAAFAYRLPVRQIRAAGRLDSGTTTQELRIYRKRDDLKYLGRVHPELTPPVAQLAAAEGQSVDTLPVEIHRHAYLSELTPDKIRWVIGLLEAELVDRPDRLGCRIELGLNLLRIGDDRGHRVLGDVAVALKPHALATAAPDPAVGQLLEYVLTTEPKLVQGPINREVARRLAEQWFSRTPPVVWAVASERFQAEDFGTAAGLLDRLLEMKKTGWYDASLPFDPAIFGPPTLLNLGICYFQLKNWVLARACFEPLLGEPSFAERAGRLLAATQQNLMQTGLTGPTAAG